MSQWQEIVDMEISTSEDVQLIVAAAPDMPARLIRLKEILGPRIAQAVMASRVVTREPTLVELGLLFDEARELRALLDPAVLSAKETK